jgi:hypothetical protein
VVAFKSFKQLGFRTAFTEKSENVVAAIDVAPTGQHISQLALLRVGSAALSRNLFSIVVDLEWVTD